MKLEFPSALRRRMRGHLGRAGRREVGGILMAEQISPGHFRLVDFTLDDRPGGHADFVRSVEEHEAALQRFYKRSGSDFNRFNYLGEWHSHPNHPPHPSGVDIASMLELIEGERNIPFALLLIVRKAWWRRMLATATMFQRGQPATFVAIVECE
jgi:integrative and conjugative element protein (TIGR02256 family)